jgi:hypothetical protein
MPDNPDLWEVRELPGGLALGMRAGDDPALVLRSTASEGVAQGGNRVRVELAHVKALADVALALGLVMPAGQDNGNRWQWVVKHPTGSGANEGGCHPARRAANGKGPGD